MNCAPPLVAVAHGSRDPRAAATVEALIGDVRRRRPRLRVRTSYLDHATPSPGQVLSSLAGDGVPDAVVLPLLLTAAYHSKTDLPGVLARAGARHPGMRFRYGDTLGPHPALTGALTRRLAEVGTRPGERGTAVVLAAAGSSDPESNATVAGIAAGWERRGATRVIPAYASAASPTPAEAVARARAEGARRVAIASYFLAPGYFADEVRRSGLAAGAAAVAPVLGAAPEVADVVLERYDERVTARTPEVAVAV